MENGNGGFAVWRKFVNFASVCLNGKPFLQAEIRFNNFSRMREGNDKIYSSAYSGDDSIPVYVAFAIEQYKHHKGISGEEAMEILSEAGVLEHLAEFYDVMHQHGAKWLMEEIDHLMEFSKKG